MPQGKKVYVLKNMEEGFGFLIHDPGSSGLPEPSLLMVRRVALETGGSPLALRGTENFENVVC